VEDLHWLDPSTLELLSLLIDQSAQARLCLILTARPEFHPPWAFGAHLTILMLRRLTPAQVERVARHVAGAKAFPSAVLQEVVRKTDGVPLFVEELTKMVLESGLLEEHADHYTLHGPLPPLAIPATLHDALLARLDRLGPAKQAAQLGATLGRSFAYDLLQAVARLEAAPLQDALAQLVEAEVVTQRGLPPQATYTFKHALIQDAAYQSLLRSTRQQYHQHITQVLEAQFPDTVEGQPALLAYHALGGEMWEKAVSYFQQAGEQAVARSAHREAEAAFEKALEALQHLPESRETIVQAIDLHRARGGTHFALGEPEQQLACTEHALALAETLGDPHRLALGITAVAAALNEVGDNVRAFAFAQRGLALAEAVGDLALLVTTRNNLGQICRCMGDYHRAATVLGQAVERLQGDLARMRFGRSLYTAVTARINLTACLAELGEFRQATATAEEGLRIAEALQQSSSLLIALRGVCTPLLHQGRFHHALPWLERAFALCTPDLVGWHSSTLAARGYAYAMTGRLTEALPQLEQAVALARHVNRRNETRWLAYLSEVYLRADRQADAHTLAEQLLALSHERGERGMEAWGLSLLGAVAARCDPSDATHAETAYRQALTLAAELGMRPLQAHCHHGLGTLYAQLGQQGQACTELVTAIDLYRAMEMTFWLPQAEAALVQMEAR
jgi:tetratricopeptide (TPR) repeat protein